MERDADVVVVGAGIVGCATAYFLARRGARVVMVERGPVPGEQSRKNWGFVRQQGRDPVEMPLVMEAHRLWRGLPRELGADIEWIQGGNLALAADDRRMARLERGCRSRASSACRRACSARVISAPSSRPRRRLGGRHAHARRRPRRSGEDDRRVRAGRRRVRGEPPSAVPVQGVSTRAGAVSGVVTEHGEIRTPTVVCAAGAWSARLARTLASTSRSAGCAARSRGRRPRRP